MNTVILFGGIGALLICLGSFAAIVAPGDGQTGMVVFPLWLAGSVSGIFAIVRSFGKGASSFDRIVVCILAAMAVGSVIWSFQASTKYGRGQGHARIEPEAPDSEEPGEEAETSDSPEVRDEPEST